MRSSKSTSKRLTKLMSTSKRLTKVKKNHAYELKIHKSGAYELNIHNRFKSHAYEWEIHKKSWRRAEDSQNWCVRAEDSQSLQKSCVRVGDSQKSHGDELKIRKTACELKRLHNSQPRDSCKRDDAFVQPVVEDPGDADRVLVETRAEPLTIPCEPSESEKMKRDLTHIPFKLWCTSCVKGKAQSEPHNRVERTIEDSELPTVQCEYLVLKGVAACDGLKVLSMYEKSFGYGTSTVVETKGATDTFAVT